MSGPPPDMKTPSLALALVALATREGLGEPVVWPDVKGAIANLIADPVGPRDLRATVRDLNDADVAATLEDWFARAAAERDEDAKAANRAAEKLLAPLQIVSLGGGAAAALSVAVGTAGAIIGAPIAASAFIVGAAASCGRWRLSKREDEARTDVNAIHRLAAIAGSAANKSTADS